LPGRISATLYDFASLKRADLKVGPYGTSRHRADLKVGPYGTSRHRADLKVGPYVFIAIVTLRIRCS